MRDPLELLWLDPRSPARLRRKPEWQRLLDEARAGRKASDLLPLLPNQKASPEDRADVMEILKPLRPLEAGPRSIVPRGVA